MNIILLDKIANLGGLGDQVTVKSGYARNFLFPQGKAVPATKDNVEKFEARRAELEAKIAEQLAAANARAVPPLPRPQEQAAAARVRATLEPRGMLKLEGIAQVGARIEPQGVAVPHLRHLSLGEVNRCGAIPAVGAR